jgi:hypothetical protein
MLVEHILEARLARQVPHFSRIGLHVHQRLPALALVIGTILEALAVYAFILSDSSLISAA